MVAAPAADAEDDFKKLFDGSTLKGWRGDTGTFYEEQGRGTLVKSDFKKLKPFIKKGDWNTYEIRATGNRFELTVNGHPGSF